MDMFFEWSVYESTLSVFANFALVSIITSAATFFASIVTFPPSDRQEGINAFVMMLSISLLGGLTGYAGGNSREGVVGDVIPGVLAFLSGAVLYLFGLEKQPAKITPFLLISFVVVLFIGFAMGSKKRVNFDDPRELSNFQRQTCVDVFSAPELLANEAAIRNALRMFGDKCDQIVDLSSFATRTP